MPLMDEDGVAVDAPATPFVVTPEVARRWQDATMARLAGMGLSGREIGLLMRYDASTVCRRLRGMPAEVRRHFARLGG